MRLDAYLVHNGLAQSRTRAQDMIKKGGVTVNGKPAKKSSIDVIDGDDVVLDTPDIPYVSRAALKLAGLFEHIHLGSLEDRVVIDVGASTGGFTQVCLEKGAGYVYAVDVGQGQFHGSLTDDDRICVMEQTDARTIDADMFPKKPTVLVSDVSFISQTKVLPHVLTTLASIDDIYILIKPQFELEPEDIGKGGLVKDEEKHAKAIESVKNCLYNLGYDTLVCEKSTITGGDGNQEYMAHARRR